MMPSSRLFAFAAGLALLAADPAFAKEEDGINVQVQVLDPTGSPIPTAVVRHPDEAERHRVNTVTGIWEGNVLYLPDGSMIKFEKGMELAFEVSAPGYVTETVRYLVRKRKNLIQVSLEQMAEEEIEEEEMPIIGFGRDKPID